MKYRILFFGEKVKKKNITSLSSAEIVKREVNVELNTGTRKSVIVVNRVNILFNQVRILRKCIFLVCVGRGGGGRGAGGNLVVNVVRVRKPVFRNHSLMYLAFGKTYLFIYI